MNFFSSFSLENKFLGGLFPLLLFSIFFAFYVEHLNRNIEISINNVEEVFSELQQLSRLDKLNTELAEATKAFTLTNDIRWQNKYDDLSLEADNLFRVLVNSISLDKETFLEFEARINKIKGTELLILSKVRDGNRDEAISLFDNIYSEEQQIASRILSDYVNDQEIEVENQINGIHAELQISKTIIILAFIILILTVFVVCLLMFSLFILKPLKNLSHVATSIATGDINQKAQVYYHDEIGHLALSFNLMTETLRKKIDDFDKLLKQQDISGRLLVRRDIDLTQANEMLRDLDKRKSEFVSIVAHQLRTPLSGIKWTLSMLIKGELGALNDDQKDLLGKTFESNERMILLVEDMLYADRLESGKNSLTCEPSNVIEIIDDVLLDLYKKIKDKKLVMNFTHTKDIPTIKIDREKIRAVTQNILENAVKYTPDGGKVTIEIIKNIDEVVIKVSDTGIGIPKDQQKYLFSKFFRAKNAMSKVTEGTGLGLFIAKNIVEKHGGKIKCSSEEGKGTTIEFSLKTDE